LSGLIKNKKVRNRPIIFDEMFGKEKGSDLLN
jgi:hypothetical protein